MRRAPRIALIVVAAIVAITGAAFALGTPQAPPSPAVSPAPAASQPSGPPMGGDVIVDGEMPTADPSSPFTFQIPGCRCHSDDPAVVEEHAQYRLNQCAGCHRSR